MDVHDIQILPRYVVVRVEYVHFPFRFQLVEPPPNDEIKTFRQALMHRIQWKRPDIVLNPEPMDSCIG